MNHSGTQVEFPAYGGRGPAILPGQMLCLACSVLLLGAGGLSPRCAASDTGGAGSETSSPGEIIVLRRCPVDYSQTSQLGAATQGVIQDCLVKVGERVKAGQVLGRLQDVEQRAELELRAAEAASDIEVRLAEAKFTQSQARFKIAEALRTGNAISADEFALTKYEAEAARLGVEDAKHRKRLNGLRHRQAQAAVRVREVSCAHDGVVVAVYKNAGESVLNEPIFRVVNVDRLHVTGKLDVVDAWRVKTGQSVQLFIELPGVNLPVGNETFTGRLVFVDSEIDPKTRTCKVVAEVDNRKHLLRSGLEARMEISPAGVVPSKFATQGKRLTGGTER